MKSTFLLFVFISVSISSYAQEKVDTIYTFNKTIVGKVKEVSQTEILYTLPQEEVVYRMYKRAVLSITFASGRKEVFNERKNLEPVTSSGDWEKVELTTNPDETSGMVKIEMVSVKATGATVYSSVTNTQDRAYRKLKHAAAILGGNMVLIDNQSVEGNIYKERTTRTQLTGTIFRSIPKDTTGLLTHLVNHKFKLYKKRVMAINDAEPNIVFPEGNTSSNPRLSPPPKQTQFVRIEKKDIEFSNGITYLNTDIFEDVKKFIVTNHTPVSFTIAYQHRSRFVEMVFERVKD